MERDPKNKVVAVTGGARGIGFAIAEQFLKHGAKKIIIVDILETVGLDAAKTLNNTYKEDKAVFIKWDVTKDVDKITDEIFKKYQVDVLVNNAGVGDEESFRKTIEINCCALVEWSMKFWEYRRTDKGGKGGTIFNVASIFGYEFSPWVVYYKTSKHAVLGFTRSLGHPYNYEKSGVRVIAICPGVTDTAILNCKVWDWQKEDFEKFVTSESEMQTPTTLGEAAVEVFTVAETGTVWVKENNEPIKLAPLCQ